MYTLCVLQIFGLRVYILKVLSYVFGLVTYGSRCASTCVFALASRIKYATILCYYHTVLLCIYICIYMYILVYMYTYNRVTSICIDLSKIKLFVFVFGYTQKDVPSTTQK